MMQELPRELLIVQDKFVFLKSSGYRLINTAVPQIETGAKRQTFALQLIDMNENLFLKRRGRGEWPGAGRSCQRAAMFGAALGIFARKVFAALFASDWLRLLIGETVGAISLGYRSFPPDSPGIRATAASLLAARKHEVKWAVQTGGESGWLCRASLVSRRPDPAEVASFKV